MPKMETLIEFVRVGCIQTTLDHQAAWANGPTMSEVEQENAQQQIARSLNDFNQLDKNQRPQIILLPELSVPQGFLRDLQNIANMMECVIIAGIDYKKFFPNKIKNEAVVITPASRNSMRIMSRSTTRYVGKTYPAPTEEAKLQNTGYKFTSDNKFWIFEDEEYGKFGVAICYDFLDLERASMYRGKVQHLFILAYNKDVTSFQYVAETLCRTVFCNVVVCNTGYFGGSLAVSPYYTPFKRTIYSHEGKGLYTQQVVNLPVKTLFDAQQSTTDEKDDKLFKAKPPGFVLTK